MNSKNLYLKLLSLSFIVGVFLIGCGKSSNLDGIDSESKSDEKTAIDEPEGAILDNFINKNTYLEIAKFSYMSENMHVLRRNKIVKNSKSLPGGNENKLYPGDIQKLIKQNNLFEVSSELMSDNFINKLYIENKSSKISVDVDRDRGTVIVSLFRDDLLIRDQELEFELFADSAADRYYKEN